MSFVAESENIMLSLPQESDMDYFLDAGEKSLELHHPWVVPPSDETQYLNYLASLECENRIGFFVKLNDDEQIVGVININEIVKGVFQSGYLGFYAFSNYTGKGYMSEGLKLVLSYYFEELKLHRLEANIQPGNEKSIALVRRMHFRHEGHSPNYLQISGEWQDHERFALTLEDYLS